MKPSINVVHLIWLPYGIQLFKDFVDSYKSFKAGYTHELILLFNGITNEQEAGEYHQYIKNYGIQYQAFYYKKGQDLEAYRWVANQLSSDHILFLNSYSRFLTDNWLQKFVQAQQNSNAGMIGATGSWQSYYSTIFENNKWLWIKNVTVGKNIRRYKLLLKTLFLWRWYFKPFPNPHVRTNAFLIHRQQFLNLKFKHSIQKKMDAYRLESGRHSITNQLLQKGVTVLLIGKNGSSYPVESWNNCNIFWMNNQENLLIADNQTETYIHADVTNKKLMEKSAWGVNQLPY